MSKEIERWVVRRKDGVFLVKTMGVFSTKKKDALIYQNHKQARNVIDMHYLKDCRAVRLT